MYPADVIVAADIALPIALAWMLAALFWLALPLGDSARSIVVAGMLLPMFSLPFLAPAEHPVWRGIAAIACVTPWLKVYDLHYQRCLGGAVPPLGQYLLFQINPCMLVLRRLSDEPQPPTSANVLRMLRGMAIILLATPALWWVFVSADHGTWPFWIEHSAKALLVFALVFGMCDVIVGLWRLLGFRGRTMMLNFFAARTPAEFWRLYNRHTGQFFFEDVARPLQRRIGPAAATMTAFAASGLAHEYLAFVAIGRIQMFQTSFFLLQGLAVVLTQRVRPRGAGAYLGIASTLVFNLATSLLFFASANQFVHWYSDAASAWAEPR